MRTLAFSMSLFVACSALAEPVAADQIIQFEVEKYLLPNGLEVLLHRDARVPTVTVNVWYHVGSIDEQTGKTGFAHLFEHLMFQGSKHVQGDAHMKFLEEAGASPFNGTTSLDRTNYFETVPKNELELALWLESDRMGYLLDGVTSAKLDEQRSVVKQERRQRVEAAPYGLAEEKLWQALFPAPHPYGGMIIGSMADLDKASMDDVRHFYDDGYAPSNATLCIDGDFDAATVKGLVDKYFKTFPAWPKPKRIVPPAPSLSSEVVVQHDETVAAEPLLELAWITPPHRAPGDMELDVLADILGTGLSSRLQSALVVETQQVTSVVVRQESSRSASVFRIAATVKPGLAPLEVKKSIQAQLDYLLDAPPSIEEVTRAKNRLETAMTLRLANSFDRADIFQAGNDHDGDPLLVTKDIAKLRAITPEQVLAAFKAHLPSDRRAVLIATPKMLSKPSPVVEKKP
jgi:zinc protease